MIVYIYTRKILSKLQLFTPLKEKINSLIKRMNLVEQAAYEVLEMQCGRQCV